MVTPERSREAALGPVASDDTVSRTASTGLSSGVTGAASGDTVSRAPSTGLPPGAGRYASGLERYRLAHRALPGRDLAEVGLATPLLGAVLAAPLLIAAGRAHGIGRLARAASEHGLGLVVGGGERLLADPDLIAHYRTPDRPTLLLAAVGFEHILDGDGPERAERLAEMLDADGLVIDLDVVGAAMRPDGDARARRAEATIAAVVQRLAPLPVVVRETGSGMDGADARALAAIGVAAVDTGGAGARDRAAMPVADTALDMPAASAGERDGAFAGWGVPLADAVAEAVLLAPGLPVIAGGPLTDGVEVAACLALGAIAACLERPFADTETASETAAALVHQLHVAVWATGAPSAASLNPGHLRDTSLA
jgi:isopentenyl-diphosphate Delta-isomerase